MSVRNSKKIEEKRESIINSAIKVFARKGFENARISDIASEAGTAYGLVYHYFDSKEELLKEIIEDKWALFLKSIKEVDEKENGFRQKIIKITTILLDTYKKFPELMRVLVAEYSRSPRLIKEGVKKPFLNAIKVFEGIIKKGQMSGEVREDVSPLMASLMYMGVIDTIFTLAEIDYRGKFTKSLKRRAEAIIDIYLNGLCKK
jgi:TetR/AcrR family fatty acid metabolism transcriptional regulator